MLSDRTVGAFDASCLLFSLSAHTPGALLIGARPGRPRGTALPPDTHSLRPSSPRRTDRLRNSEPGVRPWWFPYPIRVRIGATEGASWPLFSLEIFPLRCGYDSVGK